MQSVLEFHVVLMCIILQKGLINFVHPTERYEKCVMAPNHCELTFLGFPAFIFNYPVCLTSKF